MRAFVKDQPVSAHVRFLDVPSPIEGEAGEGISAEAGTQRIEVAIGDAAALIDRPTQTLSVFVQPGQESVAEARFPWTRARFNVIVGGRRQPGVTIKLLRKDAVVAELKSGSVVTVSPGRYEADVLLGGRSMRARGIALLEGATQEVPLQF